jgi:hypothetical protein
LLEVRFLGPPLLDLGKTPRKQAVLRFVRNGTNSPKRIETHPVAQELQLDCNQIGLLRLVRSNTVQRSTPHASGKRCVKGGKGKRCTLAITMGSFTRQSVTGTNMFRFTGRLNGGALARGDYMVVALATDSAGNKSKPQSQAFRIIC